MTFRDHLGGVETFSHPMQVSVAFKSVGIVESEFRIYQVLVLNAP